MFYRVDYVLACILTGIIAGVLAGKRTRAYTPQRIGNAYYIAVSVLIVITLICVAAANIGHPRPHWNVVAGTAGTVSNLLFGGLWGLTMGRRTLAILESPGVMEALRMSIAFTFAVAAVGKAFSMSYMTDFFTHSGYNVEFLKFIMLAEALGAVGLLVPWALVPALMGLSVDMFGAVATHVRNGDALNDSTGAINMLLRLSTLGFVLAISAGISGKPATIRTPRYRVIALFVALGVCASIAVIGAHLLHA